MYLCHFIYIWTSSIACIAYLDGRGQERGLCKGGLVGEYDAEGEAEREQQRDEGQEEVDEARSHGHEHVDIDTELGHLPHQDHVDEPRDGDADARHVVLPAPDLETALLEWVLVEAYEREAQDYQ